MFFGCLCYFISILKATVLVTHGLGTSGIAFYHSSGYITALTTSAAQLGQTLTSVPWLSATDPNKEYAGLHPQERIAGATTIAKAIIDNLAAGQKVILIGHSFGGQVMQCATRLLNPANKEITDTFIYELVYAIKSLLNENQTKGVSPKVLINGIIAGWHLSKVIIAAIEKANIINQHIIDFVKQHLSLDYIQAIKNTWAQAFDEVQRYKIYRNINHRHAVIMLYTIGTPFNGSAIFTADMEVTTYHVNLYSVEDTMPAMVGSPCAPLTSRTANIRVHFEPTKAYAPAHHEFCGNLLMAPWILTIPFQLKEQHMGSFDRFTWGATGAVTFFANQAPRYQPD
jgi:thioesterase domain-containing protein